MWKLHEIKDDWGVGWQVGTVIGKDADGGDILASVPHTFTDQATSRVFDFCATAALMLIAGAAFSGLCWQRNMWLAICAYWCVLLIKNAVLFAAHDEMKEEEDAD